MFTEERKLDIPVDGKDVQHVTISADEIRKKCLKPPSGKQFKRMFRALGRDPDFSAMFKGGKAAGLDSKKAATNMIGDLFFRKRLYGLIAKKVLAASKKFTT